MQVGITDAKKRMDELFDRALAGEEVIFTNRRSSVAQLVAMTAAERAAYFANLASQRSTVEHA